MASYDTINYSLSPNKAIQRHIIFDCLDIISNQFNLSSATFIGFGSIWFSDFVIAHKRLGISKLISIENKPVGAQRARFNAPFRTISVEEGDSTPVLKDLAATDKLLKKPWIAWLDYDRSVTDTTIEDISIVVNHAPPNSIFIATVDAGGLGLTASKRAQYFRTLLGDSVPDDLTNDDFQIDKMPMVLAQLMLDYIAGQAISGGRAGGFIPAFNIPYKDSAQMLTFGGILPDIVSKETMKQVVMQRDWPGFPKVPVQAPPLTLKEVTALQKLLPHGRPVTRARLRKLGFDLLDDQLEAYLEHYRRYPTFLQVIA